MPQPHGTLTPAQYEIMLAVWEAGLPGATAGEIWQAVRARRSVTRTTVLNLVDRLAKRGWLKRSQHNGAFHYVAALDRSEAEQRLAGAFVSDFFGGSASDLVMSLLGRRGLKTREIDRLRRMLDEAAGARGKGGRP